MTDKQRDCPDCGKQMNREDRGYVYIWNCDNEECANANGYWHVYDREKYFEAVRNQ